MKEFVLYAQLQKNVISTFHKNENTFITYNIMAIKQNRFLTLR